jgi:hypothetical protein
METDQLSKSQDGLLPQPDAVERVRLFMSGSWEGKLAWRRLLPPSVFSLTLHFFFLTLLMVITVTFSAYSGVSTWDVAYDDREQLAFAEGDNDFGLDYALPPVTDERFVAELVESENDGWPVKLPANQTGLRPQDNVVAVTVSMSQEENGIYGLLNHCRVQQGKKALQPRAELFQAARAHAVLMAQKYSLRSELGGKDVRQRVLDAGYKPKIVHCQTFTIMYMNGDGFPLSAIRLCDDLLGPDAYQHIGIGIAKADEGRVYYELILAVPVEP